MVIGRVQARVMEFLRKWLPSALYNLWYTQPNEHLEKHLMGFYRNAMESGKCASCVHVSVPHVCFALQLTGIRTSSSLLCCGAPGSWCELTADPCMGAVRWEAGSYLMTSNCLSTFYI